MLFNEFSPIVDTWKTFSNSLKQRHTILILEDSNSTLNWWENSHSKRGRLVIPLRSIALERVLREKELKRIKENNHSIIISIITTGLSFLLYCFLYPSYGDVLAKREIFGFLVLLGGKTWWVQKVSAERRK